MLNVRRLASILGLLAVAVCMMPGGARAATVGWSVVPTPNGRATDAYLNAVSCSSTSACTAVGQASNSMGVEAPLAERWNGSNWTIQSTPTPTGTQNAVLVGVSCTSASACMAVGYYDGSSLDTEVVFSERWDGVAWTIPSTPNPPDGVDSYLEGVSCPSADQCTAVGDYVDSTGDDNTLAERWDGAAWTIQSIPTPTGGHGLKLYAVSCVTESWCTAVGYNTVEGSDYALCEVALAERWDGSSWTIQRTPTSDGCNELLGVSCTAANACTAVGGYNGSPEQGLVDRWNGTGWKVQSTPTVTNGAVLLGVSCTSTSVCTATGWSRNGSGGQVTLAERWDGSSWAIQSTPTPTGASGALYDVSCASASECAAVGSSPTDGSDDQTLAERWRAPTVIAVSPDAGPIAGGNTVTVKGTGFVSGASVSFGGVASPSVTYVSPNNLAAVVPAAAAGKTVDVSVTAQDATSPLSNADLYAYGPPTIGVFLPSSGITGSQVTINGTNLVPGITVNFGTLASSAVTFVSPTKIIASVPNGALTAKISLRTPAGTATSGSSYGVKLSVTGFSPTSGAPGTVVTVTGVGFNTSSTVAFDGVPAATMLVSPTRLTATVPSGATAGPIAVTNTAAPSGTVDSAADYTP